MRGLISDKFKLNEAWNKIDSNIRGQGGGLSYQINGLGLKGIYTIRAPTVLQIQPYLS